MLDGVLASLVAGLLTGIGALPIFLRRHWSQTSQALLLAVAAGIMLGATFFSLIVPALDAVPGKLAGALVVGGGVILGATAIWLIHAGLPHQHFVKGAEGRPLMLSRHALFVAAITLHNLPEGLSVGVAYASDPAQGLTLAIGIGLQNMPEGLAVAAALIAEGYDRGRAFWVALLSGLVEPLGGLLGVILVGLAAGALPWALAFAAGAMLFVISGEVIPETHRSRLEHRATFALVGGFVLMMLLDVSLG